MKLRLALFALAVGAILLLPNAAAYPPPTRNYLRPMDMHVVSYNSVTNTVTDTAQVYTPTNEAACSYTYYPAQCGDCDYVPDAMGGWENPNNAHVLGGCVSITATNNVYQGTFRARANLELYSDQIGWDGNGTNSLESVYMKVHPDTLPWTDQFDRISPCLLGAPSGPYLVLYCELDTGEVTTTNHFLNWAQMSVYGVTTGGETIKMHHCWTPPLGYFTCNGHYSVDTLEFP